VAKDAGASYRRIRLTTRIPGLIAQTRSRYYSD
jgi:hypothetical protein